MVWPGHLFPRRQLFMHHREGTGIIHRSLVRFIGFL